MSRIIEQNRGIWRSKLLKSLIEPEYQLSMDEGSTPMYSKVINGNSVYFVDETKNPNQSFKDRSLAFQLSYYYSQNKTNFVISSSGNAARSAIAYAKLIPDAKLDVFVSDSIPNYKLNKLGSGKDIKIHKSNRAKSDAIKFSYSTGAINLRGSKDDNASIGFRTLGEHIYNNIPDADAIFVCCSSGTSTLGIYEGIKECGLRVPAIHIVQTSYIHPIAEEFDRDFVEQDSSLANAISDRVAHRKNEVIEIITQTNGGAWIVDDNDIKIAKDELIKLAIDIEGYNAYVSFAGFMKAIKKGLSFKKPVCILTGI